MIEAEIPDLDAAGLAGLVFADRHRTAERARQSLLEVAHVRRLRRRRRFLSGAGARVFLTSASVARTDKPFATTVRAARSIASALLEPEQRARVAHREALVLDELAHRRRAA